MISCTIEGVMTLHGIDVGLLERLRTTFRFPNPEKERAVRMRRFAASEPDWVEVMRELPPQLRAPKGTYSVVLPRGCVTEARSQLQREGKDIDERDDKRSAGRPIFAMASPSPPFDRLRDYQREAVELAVKHYQGLVVLPCGGGKTTVGVAVVAKIARTSLVVVPTTDLVDQWIAAARGWFPDRLVTIGRLDGSAKETDAEVVVATYESALRFSEVDPTWLARFGVLLVDEAHAVPARRLSMLVGKCPAKWRLGLTATPYREDGYDPLIRWSVGPVLLQRTERELVALGYLKQPTVTAVPTPFWSESADDGTDGSNELDGDLVADLRRAAFVADRLAALHREGHRVLVLGNRKALLDNLSSALRARGVEPTVVTGDTPKKKRKHAIDVARGAEVVWRPERGHTKRLKKPIVVHATIDAVRVCSGKSHSFLGDVVDWLQVNVLENRYRHCPRCFKIVQGSAGAASPDGRMLLATSLADQGLDLPQITVVALVFPEKARGRTTQRVGRVMRDWPGKVDPVVIDFIDDAVPMFKRRFDKRKKAYAKMGIHVTEER